MKSNPNILRAVFLPIIGFFLLLSLVKILGSTLMLLRALSDGQEAMFYFDGACAGVLTLLVSVWLWRKAWGLKPLPAEASVNPAG